jgi:hypothetical protein
LGKLAVIGAENKQTRSAWLLKENTGFSFSMAGELSGQERLTWVQVSLFFWNVQSLPNKQGR